jgi:uncharacterized membrane protein
MVQDRIGIVIGGACFMTLIPTLVLIPIAVPIALLGASAKEDFDFSKIIPLLITTLVCLLIFIPLSVFLRMGWTKICLNITKNEPARFAEFFSNSGYFVTFFFVNLLMGIAVGAGFSCLIIPGIFLLVKLCFAPLLALDKNMSPTDAMQTSWSMTKGHAKIIFLAYLVYFLAHMIASFIPFIGSIMAMAFLDLLICSIYRQINGDLVTA